MGSSTRKDIVEVFEASDAAQDRELGLSFAALSTLELLRLIDRHERRERRSRVTRHALINQLAARATEEELGGTLAAALADRVRITKAEAGRWIAEAEDLGERRTMTGQPLAPRLTATAAAQRHGLVGDRHVKLIRSFLAHLPAEVDPGTREAAEADLADKAGEYRPDQVATYARQVMDLLHPDGDYSEQERARNRGIVVGKQEFDGMSRLSGLITPALRATIEAMLAKLAAPGPATPARRTRSQPASLPRMRSRPTPAAPPNATTTDCWPVSGGCWRRARWVSTTAFPSASWSPPPSPS